MAPIPEQLPSSFVLHRELFVLPCIAVPALAVWFCCVFSRDNVIVDPLPPIVFVLNFAVLPWREDINDLELIVIFLSVSFKAVHHSIRAISKKNVDTSRRYPLYLGLLGQIIAIMSFYYANGARIVPIIPGDWAAGMKMFNIMRVKLGVQSLKYVIMILLLLDFGRLPGERWKTILVKAGQILLLWMIYSFWIVPKPHAVNEPMMTMVWAALQKSKALDLVITLRTISVLFNWTAFVPEARPQRVPHCPVSSPARAINSGASTGPQSSLLRRRAAPAELPDVAEPPNPALLRSIVPVTPTVVQSQERSFLYRLLTIAVSEVRQIPRRSRSLPIPVPVRARNLINHVFPSMNRLVQALIRDEE